MKLRTLILASLCLSVLSYGPQVFAQRVTPLKAINFLKICKNNKSLAMCDAYISGIADSVAYAKIFAKNQNDTQAPVGFCIVPSTKGREMRQKVIAWMENHSDKLGQPAGEVVFTALHEAYPCKMTMGENR
ncbi:hypothetical protein COMNV_00339 [Commensalibacter sp. Nvir]|uniref:Rap1a/Tai family immunity protein n=1 Tax=Commensalibacter sp. Nvir TaxID=3069817 RepID=UPI002D407870|nr:hypothetical protein COMNV_00339 [Commensalibacter sp. Nvir]